MDTIIVTGMSGSGKNTAFKMLEDFGYFCVDNLPAKLIDKFMELALDSPETMEKVALGIDIRGGENLDSVLEHLDQIFEKHEMFRLLFLDASDDILIRRYKESRRVHPLADSAVGLEAQISLERERLRPMKERADIVIDTSHILTRELQERLYDIFVKKEAYKNLNITVMTFGYKYGVPQEADYVIDVRFLPNPYYDQALRPLSGNDEAIRDYVFSDGKGWEFMDKLYAFLDFLIPEFIRVGKNQLVIAIGCTGGRHRSVSVGNTLYRRLSENRSYGTSLFHRDISNSRK